MATNMLKGPDGWELATELAGDYRLGVAQARAQRLEMETEQRACFEWVRQVRGKGVNFGTSGKGGFSPRACYAIARLIRGYGAPIDYWRVAAEFAGEDTSEHEPVADWYRFQARVEDGYLVVKCGRAPGYEKHLIGENGIVPTAPSEVTRVVPVLDAAQEEQVDLFRIETSMWVEALWNYGGTLPPKSLDDGYSAEKLRKAATPHVEDMLQNLREDYRRYRWGPDKDITFATDLDRQLGPPSMFRLLSKCSLCTGAFLLVKSYLAGLDASDISWATGIEESDVVLWHYLSGQDYVTERNGCIFGGRSGPRPIGPVNTQFLRAQSVGHLILRSDGQILAMYGDCVGHAVFTIENASVDHVGYPYSVGADHQQEESRRDIETPLRHRQTSGDNDHGDHDSFAEDTSGTLRHLGDPNKDYHRDKWEVIATHVTVEQKPSGFEVTGFKRKPSSVSDATDQWDCVGHRTIRRPTGIPGVVRVGSFIVNLRILLSYMLLVAFLLVVFLECSGVIKPGFRMKGYFVAFFFAVALCVITSIAGRSKAVISLRDDTRQELQKQYCNGEDTDSSLTFRLAIKIYGKSTCLMHDGIDGNGRAAHNNRAFGIPRDHICAGVVVDLDNNLRILQPDGECRETEPFLAKTEIAEQWCDTRAQWRGDYESHLRQGTREPLNGRLGAEIAIEAMMKVLSKRSCKTCRT